MRKQFSDDIDRGPEREALHSAVQKPERELRAEDAEEDGSDSAAMKDSLDEDADIDDVDEPFDDEGGEETFEAASAEGAFDDNSEGFPQTAETSIANPLEEVVIVACEARNTNEFFSRLLSHIRHLVRTPGSGAATAGSTGKAAGRGERSGQAARSTSRVAGSLRETLTILQMFASQELDELQAFQEMADWFAEGQRDEALPVLAGMAARSLALPLLPRPVIGPPRPLLRALVDEITQASHSLIQQGGAQAVRALPHIVRSVARTALRRRLPINELPEAVRRTTFQIATQPDLMRRLTSLGASTRTRPRHARVVRLDGTQRLQIRGPVEITIIKP